MKVRYGHVSNSSSASFMCKTKLSIREVYDQVVKMYQKFGLPYCQDKDFIVRRYTQTIEDGYRDFCEGSFMIPYASAYNIEIASTGDNTIPWSIMDEIESNVDLNALHIHWG